MSDPFHEHLHEALEPAYTIQRELKGGGMSRVFVAIEHALQRTVVVKVLRPDLAAGVNRERFRREIMLAAQLQHPHIVPVLSAGERGDLLWYTMPFVEGESLREAMAKRGRFSPREVVRVLHDVLDALSYAHARGVIHRDIKPGNILTHGSHALVTDFGVAKALSASMPHSGTTSAGIAIGTPAYMAPEQLAADPSADHRVDLYAVGLLAYELLTGEQPFSEQSPAETMAAQLTRMPPPIAERQPDVPSELGALVTQLLAKSPNARPPDARTALNELETLLTPGSGGVLASTTGLRSRAAAQDARPRDRTAAPRRRVAPFAIIGLAVAAVVAAAIYLRPRSAPLVTNSAPVVTTQPPSDTAAMRRADSVPANAPKSAAAKADTSARAAAKGTRGLANAARPESTAIRPGREVSVEKGAAVGKAATTADTRLTGTGGTGRANVTAGAPATSRAASALLTPTGKPKRIAVLPVRDGTPQAQFGALARALEDSLKRTAAALGYSLASDSELVRLMAGSGTPEQRRAAESSGIGAVLTAYLTLRDRELQAQVQVLDVWKGLTQSERGGTELDDPNGALTVVRDAMRALNRVSWRQRTDPKRFVVFDVDNQTGVDSLGVVTRTYAESLRAATLRLLGAGAQAVGDSAARATREANDRRFVGLQLGAGASVAASLTRRGADSLRLRLSVRDLSEDRTFDTAEFMTPIREPYRVLADALARLAADLGRVNWGPKAQP